MQKYFIVLFIFFISCKSKNPNIKSKENTLKVIKTTDYELVKSKNQNGLLILFPCFPCDIENTKTEFNIAEISAKNAISVLYMNFNMHLYLTETEKLDLATLITKTIREEKISEKNIFIGGFSGGGNVSLLITDYLLKSKNLIKPKGVFIVDAPIDLLALYRVSEKNLKLNFSKSSMQESKWILREFDSLFGNPSEGINTYEKNAPYTFESENINNLIGLNGLKVRLYTEPDLIWWKKKAKNNYEDLNAFYLKKLSEKLKLEFNETNIELIETKNKGYRANGERHPHSWSIVDKEDLIKWILE
ncbi:hypothetical protein [Polaribacter glomeratus]|uniref:Alpha/beta hydrolase n=1 Tax=Polaribacter glomeratus TaxID=102 RepID=A0A2S7WXJ6_9FLAO|nr:hypothetical protein [Polaribacter glomeratus]PQJ82299.1 hypothetical protein BTO16_06785 [Polaribacter glomeratus]TXD66892.1 hypothetical protein ESX12_05090 [Polaribacter glomeratus]